MARVRWINSSGVKVEQEVRSTDAGLVPVGEPTVYVRSDGTIPAKFKKSCHRRYIQQWLGIRWYGVPWPKRLRWSRRLPFIRVEDMDECGCIVKLKAVWDAIRFG